MSAPLRYAVVTPARNEAENLPRLAAALAAQTLPPAIWVIADDGSTDDTATVMEAMHAAHPWAQVVQRAGAGTEGGLADGRREGRDLLGFRAGLDALTDAVDVFIKMDADIDFEPDYCERLVQRFADDPTLAIASGTCYELEAGKWVRRTKSDSTVWGASRAYRWDCLGDVRALEPLMGWDGIDEVRVQLRGMHTETFVDLGFRHHRPEGGRESTSVHHWTRLGRACWYMGYRPSYLAMRALYRTRRSPAALFMLWGYAAAAVARTPRCHDRGVIDAMRERQRLSAALRRGAPAS